MKTATKVVSTRIPVNLHNDIKSMCKQRNMTMSEFMQEGFKTVNEDMMFKLPEPDKEIGEYLISLGGGALSGVLAYKGIRKVLEDKGAFKGNSEHQEFASVVGATAVALLAGFGLSKLIKALK